MDHTYLNLSNVPGSFTEDLLSTEELYFVRGRDQISDDDEDELSPSEDEDPTEHIELDTVIEWRECDVTDRQKVDLFLQRGCGCLQGTEKENCSSRYSLEEVLNHRQLCLEMSSPELDLVLLSQLEACTRQDDLSRSGRQSKKRKRTRTDFTFQGR